MSKQLYDEALADVKHVKQVAEDNAKRAILEAVTPRIKDLIERELFETFSDEEEENNMLLDVNPEVSSVETLGDESAAITLPDEEGKVTLDIDALTTSPGEEVQPLTSALDVQPEYSLGLESLSLLKPVLNTSAVNVVTKSINDIGKLIENMDTSTKQKKIAQTISRVEDMYDYVQEHIENPAVKNSLELQLETYFQELTKMSKKLRDLIKEDDSQLDDVDVDADGSSAGELTLTLTGLPDDVDLDAVGVDLLADESDDSDDASDVDVDVDADDDGDDELDLDLDDVSDQAGDDDVADLDDDTVVEIDESMLRNELLKMKSRKAKLAERSTLSDDTIVEIDENMLRREIARMKSIREDAAVWSAPKGVDASVEDDFGGGSDDGEPFLDGEVTTESDKVEMEEALNRKLAFEKRLQARSQARASTLKLEARSARGSRLASIKNEYSRVQRRFNESVRRARQLKQNLAECQGKSRSNSEARLSEANAGQDALRKQLAAKNLINAKLVYANKLLQNESLSRRQKAQAVQRLDTAKTSREAKLVYESVVKLLTRPTTVNESRTVIGSGSRPTRSAGASETLSEGFEADRWATLAGIK